LLSDLFTNIFLPILTQIWTVISTQLLPAFQQLWELVGPVLTPVLQFFATVLGVAIVGAIAILLLAILALVQMFTWLVQITTTTVSFMVSRFEQLKSMLQNIWNSIKATAISIWQSIVSSITQQLTQLNANVNSAMSNVYNTLKSWLNKMWETAKEIAGKIRKAISDAFNVDKRNSPSIRDRLTEIVDVAGITLSNIRIPDFSSQLASGFAEVGDSFDNFTGQSGIQPTFVVNIGTYAGSEMEKRELAKQLYDSLQDYNKGIGVNI
jgi:phage-related protein